MSDICAIAIMAKAPRAGKVKTRLVPPLTPDEAMTMSGSFLRDITANLALAGQNAPIAAFIAFAPAGTEHLFDGLMTPATGLILADGTGEMPARVTGFGRVLLHATRTLFDRGFAAVCLLNSDSPTLPTAVLERAAAALLAPGDRVVLGPAEDGGYYLIGMKRPLAHLFADIAWSTATVCVETQARVNDLGLDLVMLPTWYDVDDRDALSRLIGDLAAPSVSGLSAYHAQATARTIVDLDLPARLRQDD